MDRDYEGDPSYENGDSERRYLSLLSGRTPLGAALIGGTVLGASLIGGVTAASGETTPNADSVSIPDLNFDSRTKNNIHTETAASSFAPPKLLRRISSLGEARATFCIPPGEEGRIDGHIRFEVLNLKEGKSLQRARVIIPTCIGKVVMNFKTVATDIQEGNNWIAASAFNSRLGFQIHSVRTPRDSVSMVFAKKSLVKGTGPEVAEVGDTTNLYGGYKSREVVAHVNGGSKAVDSFNPPLTNSRYIEDVREVADVLGTRVLRGYSGKPDDQ